MNPGEMISFKFGQDLQKIHDNKADTLLEKHGIKIDPEAGKSPAKQLKDQGYVITVDEDSEGNYTIGLYQLVDKTQHGIKFNVKERKYVDVQPEVEKPKIEDEPEEK